METLRIAPQMKQSELSDNVFNTLVEMSVFTDASKSFIVMISKGGFYSMDVFAHIDDEGDFEVEKEEIVFNNTVISMDFNLSKKQERILENIISKKRTELLNEEIDIKESRKSFMKSREQIGNSLVSQGNFLSA